MNEPEEPRPPLKPQEPPPEFLEPPAAPAPERYPFWGYQDVALLAGLAVPLMIVAAALIGALFYGIRFVPRAKAIFPIAATFLFYGLWFLMLYELIHLRYGRPFWQSLAFRNPRHSPSTYAGWGLLTAFIAILLGVVLRPPEIKTPLEQLLQDRVSIILMGIFAVTLGPLCEELAFRGFLQPLLVRTFGAAAGVLLQAAPFTVLHGFEYAWSWQRLVIIFVAGVAFGWMRHITGSTAASTLMHGAYNFTFFIGLVAERYAR